MVLKSSLLDSRINEGSQEDSDLQVHEHALSVHKAYTEDKLTASLAAEDCWF